MSDRERIHDLEIQVDLLNAQHFAVADVADHITSALERCSEAIQVLTTEARTHRDQIALLRTVCEEQRKQINALINAHGT